MHKIVWSQLAYLSYSDISDFLTNEYSLDQALRFDEEVEKLLKNLGSFSKLCPVYHKKPILRKCIVNKHTALLYRIDGHTIHLVTFFDNRGIHNF